MPNQINAIKVKQWLNLWDDYSYSPTNRRRKPPGHFYIFSLSAPVLKTLSGIFRRTSKEKVAGHIENIQRGHEEERSNLIKRFIRYGYPYSELSKQKCESGHYDRLKKPGWLPTAIIINILTKDDVRKGKYKVHQDDLITIEDLEKNISRISLPTTFINEDLTWGPKGLHPIEVIDGQHRLWAFEEDEEVKEYEMPVVAFCGLDISWQAYLFWSINITPKKINRSLAFDLYPLLRMEDWLETEDNYIIYRETRAQELVEGLWSNENSPWFRRINMLGEKGLKGVVTQAAFIRSLISTFLKTKQHNLGGLYIANFPEQDYGLSWNGAQQLALLIVIWGSFLQAINSSTSSWSKAIRNEEKVEKVKGINDPAFSGKYSLIKTDQGVRGVLNIYNDLLYTYSDELNLDAIFTEDKSSKATDQEEVRDAIKILKGGKKLFDFINSISENLSDFDWRTLSFPNLTNNEESTKSGYKGSGGYKMLRLHLLDHLAKRKDQIAKISNEIRQFLST